MSNLLEEQHRLRLLNVGALLRNAAKTRWLHPDELYLILLHAPHEMGFSVEYKVSQEPKDGDLFIHLVYKSDRQQYYKMDGVPWVKRKNTTNRVQESFQNIKFNGVETISGVYCRAEHNQDFKRRIYKLYNNVEDHFVISHYRACDEHRKAIPSASSTIGKAVLEKDRQHSAVVSSLLVEGIRRQQWRQPALVEYERAAIPGAPPISRGGSSSTAAAAAAVGTSDSRSWSGSASDLHSQTKKIKNSSRSSLSPSSAIPSTMGDPQQQQQQYIQYNQHQQQHFQQLMAQQMQQPTSYPHTFQSFSQVAGAGASAGVGGNFNIDQNCMSFASPPVGSGQFAGADPLLDIMFDSEIFTDLLDMGDDDDEVKEDGESEETAYQQQQQFSSLVLPPPPAVAPFLAGGSLLTNVTLTPNFVTGPDFKPPNEEEIKHSQQPQTQFLSVKQEPSFAVAAAAPPSSEQQQKSLSTAMLNHNQQQLQQQHSHSSRISSTAFRIVDFSPDSINISPSSISVSGAKVLVILSPELDMSELSKTGRLPLAVCFGVTESGGSSIDDTGGSSAMMPEGSSLLRIVAETLTNTTLRVRLKPHVTVNMSAGTYGLWVEDSKGARLSSTSEDSFSFVHANNNNDSSHYGSDDNNSSDYGGTSAGNNSSIGFGGRPLLLQPPMVQLGKRSPSGTGSSSYGTGGICGRDSNSNSSTNITDALNSPDFRVDAKEAKIRIVEKLGTVKHALSGGGGGAMLALASANPNNHVFSSSAASSSSSFSPSVPPPPPSPSTSLSAFVTAVSLPSASETVEPGIVAPDLSIAAHVNNNNNSSSKDYAVGSGRQEYGPKDEQQKHQRDSFSGATESPSSSLHSIKVDSGNVESGHESAVVSDRWLDDAELSTLSHTELEALMDDHIAFVVQELVHVASLDDDLREEIDSLDANGLSLLHYCCLYNVNSLIPVLASKGAMMNRRTLDGSTALHLAAGAGHLEVVKVLVQNGAAVNAFDTNHLLPLDKAAQMKHHQVYEFLSSLSSIPTKHGRSARHQQQLFTSQQSWPMQQYLDHVSTSSGSSPPHAKLSSSSCCAPLSCGSETSGHWSVEGTNNSAPVVAAAEGTEGGRGGTGIGTGTGSPFSSYSGSPTLLKPVVGFGTVSNRNNNNSSYNIHSMHSIQSAAAKEALEGTEADYGAPAASPDANIASSIQPGNSVFSHRMLQEAIASLSLTDKCALSQSLSNSATPRTTLSPRRGDCDHLDRLISDIGDDTVGGVSGDDELVSEMQSVLSETDMGSLDLAMSLMGPSELELVDEEVRKIQNNVRAWLLRKNYMNLREAARVLQGAWREKKKKPGFALDDAVAAAASVSSSGSCSTSEMVERRDRSNSSGPLRVPPINRSGAAATTTTTTALASGGYADFALDSSFRQQQVAATRLQHATRAMIARRRSRFTSVRKQTLASLIIQKSLVKWWIHNKKL